MTSVPGMDECFPWSSYNKKYYPITVIPTKGILYEWHEGQWWLSHPVLVMVIFFPLLLSSLLHHPTNGHSDVRLQGHSPFLLSHPPAYSTRPLKEIYYFLRITITEDLCYRGLCLPGMLWKGNFGSNSSGTSLYLIMHPARCLGGQRRAPTLLGQLRAAAHSMPAHQHSCFSNRKMCEIFGIHKAALSGMKDSVILWDSLCLLLGRSCWVPW